MKTSVNKLAESILDLRIIDKKELESMIEVYFKIWQEEQSKNGIDKSNPVLMLRNEIEREKSELHVKKERLTRQIDRAKIAMKEGKKVNMNWYSSLNSALRNAKFETQRIQTRMGEVKHLEKIQNIKTNQDRRNVFHTFLSEELEKMMTPEDRVKMFVEVGNRVDEYLESLK